MPAVDHCLTRFEESLKKTMALRESCEEASLQDCCQVRYYIIIHYLYIIIPTAYAWANAIHYGAIQLLYA